MAIKFLQTADWHLGAKLTSLPEEIADLHRLDAINAISRMIKSAVDDDVNYILLPGDLFDNVKPSQKKKAILTRILNLIPKSTKVFILPGTHDYYIEDGIWHENIFSHINIFTDEGFSCFDFDEDNVSIWGVPVFKSGRDKNWLASKQELRDDRINILLYHGDYRGTGREYEKWDYPFELNDIVDSGFDYIALGHHHRQNVISNGGRTIAAYSGSPAGWSYRKSELGKRHFIIGEIDKSGVKVELKEVGCPLIHSYQIDLSKMVESEKMLKEIGDFDKSDIVRMFISPGDDTLNLRVRIDELKTEFRYFDLVEDELEQISVDPSDNYHLKRLIQKIDTKRDDGEIDDEFHNRLIKRALRIFM
ncbi:DNA repair exonuclease [bacterium]|nr:DNA repair exonuclease [bacterium]